MNLYKQQKSGNTWLPGWPGSIYLDLRHSHHWLFLAGWGWPARKVTFRSEALQNESWRSSCLAIYLIRTGWLERSVAICMLVYLRRRKNIWWPRKSHRSVGPPPMLCGRDSSYQHLDPQHLSIPCNSGCHQTWQSKDLQKFLSSIKAKENWHNWDQFVQNPKNWPKPCSNLFYSSQKEIIQEKQLNLG